MTIGGRALLPCSHSGVSAAHHPIAADCHSSSSASHLTVHQPLDSSSRDCLNPLGSLGAMGPLALNSALDWTSITCWSANQVYRCHGYIKGSNVEPITNYIYCYYYPVAAATAAMFGFNFSALFAWTLRTPGTSPEGVDVRTPLAGHMTCQ
jgi:hypothetical protein